MDPREVLKVKITRKLPDRHVHPNSTLTVTSPGSIQYTAIKLLTSGLLVQKYPLLFIARYSFRSTCIVEYTKLPVLQTDSSRV